MAERTRFVLDPRTGLGLLLLSNILIFMDNRLWVQWGWLLFLAGVLVVCGEGLAGLKWLLVYGGLQLLSHYILPASPKIIATSFLIIVNYMVKMVPCLMIGWLMVRKIPLPNMIAALRLMHVPQKFIVAISVTLRYIPAIREESRHIIEAMKLRNIQGLQKVEAFVVPLMISATGTADELSAAAVTRGIENPAVKTSLVQLKLSFWDACFIVLAVLYLILTQLFLRGGF